MVKTKFNEEKGKFILTDGSKYFKGSDFFSKPIMSEKEEAYIFISKWHAQEVANNFKLVIEKM